MTRYARALATLTTPTEIAQDEPALPADFRPAREGTLVRISVVASGEAITLTPSSGSAFELGSPAAGALATYEVALDPSRSWNVSTSDVNGATIDYLHIIETDS